MFLAFFFGRHGHRLRVTDTHGDCGAYSLGIRGTVKVIIVRTTDMRVLKQDGVGGGGSVDKWKDTDALG